MPAQIQQIAKAMGMSQDELGEGLRKGTVSMDDFYDTIMKLNSEGVEGFANFEEQARTATGGIGTALTNLRSRIAGGISDVIKAIGRNNISDFINNFSSAIRDSISALSPLGTAIGQSLGSISNYLPRAQAYMEKFAGYLATSIFPVLISGAKAVFNILRDLWPVAKSLGKAFMSVSKPIFDFIANNKDLVKILLEVGIGFAVSKAALLGLGGAVPNVINKFNSVKGVIKSLATGNGLPSFANKVQKAFN